VCRADIDGHAVGGLVIDREYQVVDIGAIDVALYMVSKDEVHSDCLLYSQASRRESDWH